MFDDVDPPNSAKRRNGLITPMAQKGAVGPCKTSWALQNLAVVCMTLLGSSDTARRKKLCLDRAFDLPV